MDDAELKEIRSKLNRWRKELPPILHRDALRGVISEKPSKMISLDECQHRYGALLDISTRLVAAYLDATNY